MKYTVFYSWQSDLPNNTNRGFIDDVIRKGLNLLNETQFEVEIAIDRDTKNTPGSPNIAHTILEKIKQCDIFVADISIINQSCSSECRNTPNPNVLLELGYALALLGTEKIILFFNEEFGGENGIPFDIRQNRRINYSLAQESEKSVKKKELANRFSKSVQEIIRLGHSSHKRQPHITAQIIQKLDENLEPHWELQKKQFVWDDIIAECEKEINSISKIDGSCDQQWDEKKRFYIKSMFIYLNSLKEKRMEHYLQLYEKDYQSFILKVNNDGKKIANDIRVSIEIPSDIILLQEWAQTSIADRPNFPKPVSSAKYSIPFQTGFSDLSSFGPLKTIMSNDSFKLPMTYRDRTHATFVKGNTITFWADKLLHAHSICNEHDTFILIPSENMSKNKIELDLYLFCAEYEEYEHEKIEIKLF